MVQKRQKMLAFITPMTFSEILENNKRSPVEYNVFCRRTDGQNVVFIEVNCVFN